MKLFGLNNGVMMIWAKDEAEARVIGSDLLGQVKGLVQIPDEQEVCYTLDTSCEKNEVLDWCLGFAYDQNTFQDEKTFYKATVSQLGQLIFKV